MRLLLCGGGGRQRLPLRFLRAGPLEALGRSEKAAAFLREGLDRPAACGDCPWAQLCCGGCKRDWTTDTAGQRQNYYCPSFRQFFAHAEPRLRRIAAAEAAARRR